MAKVSSYINHLAQKHFQTPDVKNAINSIPNLPEPHLDLMIANVKKQIAIQLCDELLETLEYAADKSENGWVIKKLDRVIKKIKTSIDKK
jgi:hypothetical protein